MTDRSLPVARMVRAVVTTAAGLALAAGAVLTGTPAATAALQPAAPVRAAAETAPAAARSASDDAPAVRWSVAPANAHGADGRRAVEHELDPGASVDEHFAVRNVSTEAVTFRLAAADGFYTRNGRFDILAADRESVDSGRWISLPESVTVPAGETAVVPFRLAVPETAEPGDHAAGITASVLSVQTAAGGASVGVESRIGFRVLTRVAGEITPKAAVAAVTSDYRTSWNPLKPGELTVTFDVVNEGNTRLLARGFVEAGGAKADFPADGAGPQELLPGDRRSVRVVVRDVWPLFFVPATATLQAASVTRDGGTTALPAVVDTTTALAVPWPHLMIVLGAMLLVLVAVWGRIRARRRLAVMLADARAAGRDEAAAAEAA